MGTNKIAIITGATKGIGKAISFGLAELGYHTILIGRNEKDLELVSNQIFDKYKTRSIPLKLDITNFNKVRNAIKYTIKEFGRIDVLVNNAGIYLGGTSEISEDDLSAMLQTNFTAQQVILSEVVPQMKKQESGYIFNVASRSGKVGFAGSGAYSASKFALVGLNESLYRELNPLGIRVTALCPGWVNTKMAFKAGTPLNEEEMIQPEDLFKTIKYLLELSSGACVKEIVMETPFNIS